MNLQPYFSEMRAVLRARGWIQHHMTSLAGVCLLGALDIVRRRFVDPELDRQVLVALATAVSGSWSSLDGAGVLIIGWNDAKCRTYADVDALLARLAGEDRHEPAVESVPPAPASVEEPELVAV